MSSNLHDVQQKLRQDHPSANLHPLHAPQIELWLGAYKANHTAMGFLLTLKAVHLLYTTRDSSCKQTQKELGVTVELKANSSLTGTNHIIRCMFFSVRGGEFSTLN